MFTSFFILIDDSHPLTVGAVELVLNQMFSNMKLQASAKWFYDEFTLDGITEYGFRVDMSGVTAETWQGFLDSTMTYLRDTYGQVKLEVK